MTEMEQKQKEHEDRLASLIFRIGDGGIKQVIDKLESLADVLAKDFSQQKHVIIKSLITCSTDLPMKSETYACLIGMLNVKNNAFGSEILTQLASRLQLSLDQHDYHSLKNITRFYGCLVLANVIEANSFLTLLDTLLSVTDNSMANPERSDTFVYIVLASFPWIYYHFSSNEFFKVKLEKRLETIKQYMNDRKSSALETTRVFKEHAPIDKLEYLMAVIQDLIKAPEDSEILERPTGLFETSLARSVAHVLKEPVLSMDDYTARYPFQGTMNVILTDTPSHPHFLPPVLSVHRFLLFDAISDILRLFSHNHKASSEYLSRIPLYFYSTRIEELGYNITEAIVESILLHILSLPKPTTPVVYYHATLFDIFSGLPNESPKAVGKCIRTVYAQMENMDVECVKRFGAWFSHHLSNFGYIWKWNEWEDVVQEEGVRKVFVTEVLESITRLAYWDRIKEVIPEVYIGRVFASEAPHVNTFSQNDEQLDALVAELLLCFKARGKSEEADAILTRVTHHVSLSMTDSSPKDVTHEVAIHCLMMTGSKSFSHILNVIERNLDLFKRLNETDEDKQKTMRYISDFWKFNTQFLEICLDKLINYGVLDYESVIRFCVGELEEKCDKWYVWSCLKCAVGKTSLKIGQLVKENDMDIDGSLSQARRDQKQAFITLFQSFKELLLKKLIGVGETILDSIWWKWATGCFLELGRTNIQQITSMKVTLATIVFSEHDTHPKVLALWKDLVALYERRMQ